MREITRILCPVDLSDTSRHAIDHAAALERWFRARIAALHVCNPLVIPMADFAVAGSIPPPALTEDEINELRAQVTTCFQSAAVTDLDVLIDQGRPANAILEHARSLPADLIVIGTHGA